MIDLSQLSGPGGSPAPSQTTAPVVPPPPPSGPTAQSIWGDALPKAPGAPTPGFHPMDQKQVDALDPGQKIARGIDFLGETLFGRGNGSYLGGVPLLGDIVGAGGNVIHGLGTLGVVKPIEMTATAASSVPLGWLPGGADETFNKLGEWSKKNDPQVYAHWQAINAAASGDTLGGGNLKADFNIETSKYIDDQSFDSSLGVSPEQRLGAAGVGSVGGAVANAINSFLGIPSLTSQRFLGGVGVFDPDNQYRNRVQESAARMDAGGEVSDVEKRAVDAFRSGEWSEDHALDYIVREGQGVTRNIVGQVLGTVLTDPLTYATLGAGSLSKAGLQGARMANQGFEAVTTYEKLAKTVYEVTKSPVMGPVLRISRGMIDPLAVYKPSSVMRATTDLLDATAIKAFEQAHGAQTFTDLRGIGRERGMSYEVDSAIASYTKDQARLMVAIKLQKDMLAEGLGEELARAPVDEIVDMHARNASHDALTELTDHMMERAKNTFTAEEQASLSGRLAATFGNDPAYWAKRMETMSHDLKSALHAVTYKRAEVEFEQARAAIDAVNYTGDLPIRNMVLMTADTLDDVTAKGIIDNIRAVLKEGKGATITMATDEWNAQSRRFPKMGNLGYATGGREQVERLVNELEKELNAGHLSRRALDKELNDPALRPIRDMLDRNSVPGRTGAAGTIESKMAAGDVAGSQADNVAEGVARGGTVESGGAIKASAAPAGPPPPQRLWNVGFRPDEEVAWGLRRENGVGRYIPDRDPTISHVVDAVPGRQPFSDTTRNFLGQVVGKSAAERINGPIDSIEAMVNTMRDGVTGRRMAMNVGQRFERSTFEAGIPKALSKEIMDAAQEMAGLERTTIRGLNPTNVWEGIHDIIPRNLRLKNGATLDIHIVMDHLLQASEGDVRIMGNTNVLSQRMRNVLQRNGIGGNNMIGQLTVTQYNKMRYTFNPMFIIQRVTDSPYYSIFHGVVPVGKGALKGANAELKIITDNLARTGVARFFSMDLPEYATRSNFTAGIKSAMQDLGLKSNKVQQIMDAPDTIIANNMTNMLHARLGDIVKGTLDNLASIAEKGDPAFRAEMLQAGEDLKLTFADISKTYAQAAGRVLDDNEVGLRYIKDQLAAWRRHVVHEDGTLDFSRLIAEGERAMPASIGDIGTIRPDILAQELGYADAAALRRDVTGHIEKIKGEFVLVKGEHDIPWLEEQLREQLGAHPDYTRRASAYFGESWDDFWSRLSRGPEVGGLDISPHYAKEAQDLIAIWARDRGMDPWEYLSGVMASNIGAKDLETHIGQLMGFLKSGKAQAPLEEWTKLFRSTLDVSAQKELLREYAEATGAATAPAGVIKPAEFTFEVPKSAPGKAARPPVAKLPAVFKHEAGYVYRVEDPDAVLSGWPKQTGVTTGKPTAFYSGKKETPEAIFRTKAGAKQLDAGRHGTGGSDRLTKNAVAPEDIEILTADGTWHPLSSDPYNTYFETQFPEVIRQRLLDDVPHPNPEVEGYIQQFSKWVHSSIKDDLGGQTRHDLRRLVEAVPTNEATPFNRSHALVVSLLKDKITEAQNDIFRLAEMQTKRTVLERSLNHPLFGLYPASYMWGKVLPETVKFLAKNPYAATYVIADVQRAIAMQREFDPEMDEKMNAVDRSSGAFLLDYLTPGLPWSDHQSRTSPLVRDIMGGETDLFKLFGDTMNTMSPDRWVRQVRDSIKEIPGAVESLQTPSTIDPGVEQGLQNISGGAAPAAPDATKPQITGPTPASALAPILQDDLSRLSDILLRGQSPDE